MQLALVIYRKLHVYYKALVEAGVYVGADAQECLRQEQAYV